MSDKSVCVEHPAPCYMWGNVQRERDELRAALEDEQRRASFFASENRRLEAEVNDLTNAATTAKNLLSRKHPNSVADCDGDAWEAWAVLEAALVNDKEC